MYSQIPFREVRIARRDRTMEGRGPAHVIVPRNAEVRYAGFCMWHSHNYATLLQPILKQNSTIFVLAGVEYTLKMLGKYDFGQYWSNGPVNLILPSD
jgi:hypothetical protein